MAHFEYDEEKFIAITSEQWKRGNKSAKDLRWGTPFIITENGDIEYVEDKFKYTEEYCMNTEYSPKNPIDVEQYNDKEFEPIHGVTGQYGYNGCIMHPSEAFGGTIVRYAMASDRAYYIATIESLPEDNCQYCDECSVEKTSKTGICECELCHDEEPVGWAIFQSIKPVK